MHPFHLYQKKRIQQTHCVAAAAAAANKPMDENRFHFDKILYKPQKNIIRHGTTPSQGSNIHFGQSAIGFRLNNRDMM